MRHWLTVMGLTVILTACGSEPGPQVDGSPSRDTGPESDGPRALDLVVEDASPGEAKAAPDTAVTPPPPPVVALDCTANPVSIHPLFTDHMVLQREAWVPVWGCAKAGTTVNVAVAGQTVTAVADAKGLWRTHLAPMPGGGPFTLTLSGSVALSLQDLMVGDVYLCSGQSNMAMAVSGVLQASQEIADAANHPSIRLFSVPTWGAPAPEQVFHGATAWARASQTTVPSFSASCYFFGRELSKKLAVPLGLIDSSVGGTAIEWWIGAATLKLDPDFAAPALWTAAAKIPAGKDATSYKAIAALHNGMIAPLVPFAIRGAVWYQGEGNAGKPAQYKRLLPALIQDWRDRFGAGVAALVVQLPRYQDPQTSPSGPAGWAPLREAQLETAIQGKSVGLAVTIDTGMVPTLLAACKTKRTTCLASATTPAQQTACENAYTGCVIHPADKQDVGSRLALAARGMIYKEAIDFTGPVFAAHQIQGNKVVLTFKQPAPAGLMVGKKEPLKPATADAAGKLTGFAIAGANKTFVWGTAVIKGDTVEVSSSQVATPAAVRYGWASNPPCNLYSKAGLPASPFRTDAW